MLFYLIFSIAAVIFLLGVCYRIRLWFCLNLGDDAETDTPLQKLSSAIKGMAQVLFSYKILILLKVFIVDIIFQLRTLKESPYRWAMHILIYYGFMLLLLMHGLEPVIAEAYLPDYYSTLNPYLFLRDFAGFMVIAGVLMALYRRFSMRHARLKTGGMDLFAVVIVGAIILSGILLEGFKITSYTRYQEMVEDYADAGDEEERKALESLWVKEYGVVSPKLKGPFEGDVLEKGRELNESCISCHSRPQWAFLGYGLAKTGAPAAVELDEAGLPSLLWHLHFLACFIGLAYLPFSKLFHIFASPISLLANAVMDPKTSRPQNFAVKQMMELDACTHCGACTTRCSVGIVMEEIPNIHILPSEKISALKKLAAQNSLEDKDIRMLQEGLYLCTNCHRCTDVCPAGINLQQLWHTAREFLLRQEHPELLIFSPLSLYRGLLLNDQKDELKVDQYLGPINRVKELIKRSYPIAIQDNTLKPDLTDQDLHDRLAMSIQSKTFSCCYGCMTCTDACPVMHNYENPQKKLGLVPHQMMQSLHLGYTDMVLGSGMLWACLGCYQCHDHCPQGVHITDVFYELKNIAIKKVKNKTTKL